MRKSVLGNLEQIQKRVISTVSYRHVLFIKLDQNSVSGRYLLEKQPHLKGRFIEIDKPAQKGDIVLKQMNDMH